MAGPRTAGRRNAVLAAVAVAALGYAGLSVALAFDRAAANDPGTAARVPEPFRQHALASESKALLLAGKAGQIAPLAEALVRRDPLGPQAAGLLGTARLAQGDARGAANAFRTSAKLGWRDAATQVYWLQTALAAGDLNRAGTRFGAIARQWPEAPAIDQLSAGFEDDPRGQMLIAQQIASGANWARAYAQPQPGQPLNRLAGRATVLISAAGLGNKLGCDAIAQMVVSLAQAQAALASKLWSSQCPRAAVPGQINDAGFEQTGEAGGKTPFDWQFPGNGALLADVVGASSGQHVLRASSTAATLVPLTMQRIVLAPGAYRLTWREAANGPARSSRIAVSLSCRPERVLANPLSGAVDGGRGIADLTHGGGCEAPLLQLWLAPGTGEVSIDDIALEPR
jgi:hypothetical protein